MDTYAEIGAKDVYIKIINSQHQHHAHIRKANYYLRGI